jgi:nicotinate phosphoribosyltransferase
VKLSDNPRKSTGPADEIARYRRVFGWEGAAESAVLV